MINVEMADQSHHCLRARSLSFSFLLLAGHIIFSSHPISARRIHDRLPILDYSSDTLVRRGGTKPLKISNQCGDIIYPGLETQAGTGSDMGGGFMLDAGEEKDLTVSSDWQGRVWDRTNCSFNDAGTGPSNHGGLGEGGQACLTGDCNGVIDCLATVSMYLYCPCSKSLLTCQGSYSSYS
jgi:hypothetical protein